MIPVTTDREDIIEMKRSVCMAIIAQMPVEGVVIDGKFYSVVVGPWHERRW